MPHYVRAVQKFIGPSQAVKGAVCDLFCVSIASSAVKRFSLLTVSLPHCEITERIVRDRTHLRRVEGHRLRQLHRRAGGGDGDVGFRRRCRQDRAARRRRPVPAARRAGPGAAAQPGLHPRRPQQAQPRARPALRGGARGALPAGARCRRLHHQLPAPGAPAPRSPATIWRRSTNS